MIASYLAPESPWWLVRHGRLNEARSAIERLSTPYPEIEFDIDAHIELLRITNEFEKQTSTGAHYWDMFRETNL